MTSITSSYHPIDAAILGCDLAAYQDDILRVDVSQPGCLRKHFPGRHILDIDMNWIA